MSFAETVEKLLDENSEDLKQTSRTVKEAKKKIVPGWDFKSLRGSLNRQDISNEFVRNVAENLETFCFHEKDYLQKNCKWNILHPPELLPTVENFWKKETEADSWIEKT